MALTTGDAAPDFRAMGSDGEERSRASLLGHAYVLTFYPKDETAGCVAQVCALRDAWEEFRGRDVLLFGVSRDGPESHRAFVANRKLPYVLLTDATGAMHKSFDVGRTFLGITNRVSYLVDPRGAIAASYESNLRPAEHAKRMLAAAQAAPGRPDKSGH